MKNNTLILIISLIFTTNVKAALLYDSGALLNGGVNDIYSISSRAYNSSAGIYEDTVIFQSFLLNENTTIDRIEYYVLSDTYNSTNISIFNNTSSGNLLYESSVNATIVQDGGFFFIAGRDGRIRNSYLHTLDNLNISLSQGQFSLGISLDSNSTSYFGTSTSGNIAIKVYGTTNISTVPLPPSIWLFIAGLAAMIKPLKHARKP